MSHSIKQSSASRALVQPNHHNGFVHSNINVKIHVGVSIQEVNNLRQQLYDFPWSNVGRLTFLVRLNPLRSFVTCAEECVP